MILQHAIHVVNKRGIEIAILMFDGLMIYGDYYKNNEFEYRFSRENCELE